MNTQVKMVSGASNKGNMEEKSFEIYKEKHIFSSMRKVLTLSYIYAKEIHIVV